MTRNKLTDRWWLMFIVVSTGTGALFGSLRLPGGWLIGALLGALALSIPCRKHPTVPQGLRIAAQAVLGSFLASQFDLASFSSFGVHWLPMTLAVLAALILSVVLAILFSRITKVNIETSILGLLPGGAGAMVAMSLESETADARLVSLMQYIRLCIVVLATGVLSHYVLQAGTGGSVTGFLGAMPSFREHWKDILFTPLLTLVGAWLGKQLRVPAGTMVVPMLLGIFAKATGIMEPLWLPGFLPAAYILIGMYVGALFNKESLAYARRIAPYMIGATFVLIGVSAAMGGVLTYLVHTTSLTAYLATTPGGMDSVAAIALSAEGTDLSFVVSLQMMRMLIIVMLGPLLARFVMTRRRMRKDGDSGEVN
jgi:uncharacterized protein